MSSHSSLSDPAAVEAILQESWGNLTTEIETETGDSFAAYQAYLQRIRRTAWIMAGIFVLFMGVLVWYMRSHTFNPGLVQLFAVVSMIVLSVTWAWFSRDSNGTTKAFTHQLHQVLIPKLFRMLGLAGQWIPHTKPANTDGWWTRLIKRWRSVPSSHEGEAVQELLHESELITEPYNRITVDDMYQVTYDDSKVFLSELHVRHVQQRGKHRKVKEIFRGYFVVYDLARKLEGKTFISTDGDTKGFGHRSFWSGLSANAPRQTLLEWNEFEDLLHVATTNETEARYILTTDFMADLYDWWQDKPQNIRIAFLGQRMYVLFPDKQIRFKRTVKSLRTVELQAYAATILRPMLHVLHLIDDVPLRR